MSRCYSSSMPATTVKVEGDLLKAIEQIKPRDQTVTAFVREVLEREVRRAKLRDAAIRYTEFIRDADDERDWMSEWESADLAGPVRKTP